VVNARSGSGLAVAAAALQERGAQVVTVPGDVADPALAQRLVDAATERFDRLDVLVTNAGSIQVGPALAMRARDFTNGWTDVLRRVAPGWPSRSRRAG
jgi:NAD(P)-dependent dehydrogenase (short-subunit alcohol dehydrogenase family)